MWQIQTSPASCSLESKEEKAIIKQQNTKMVGERCVHARMCTNTCVHAHIHAHIHVHMCVTYTWIYVHMYTYV